MPTPEEVDAFATRALGDVANTFAVLLSAIGDRHGLFKDLAAHGPHTAEEIAECSGLSARYVREWAACLASAGYLRYDPATARFALPPAHVPVLAEEGGPAFVGGFLQQVAALVKVYEPVAEAFVTGKGVPRERYDRDLFEGEARGNDMWHNHLLVKEWLPRLPDVKAKLERGCDVLDVGCGGGKALVRLAQAFPRSRFVGIDIHQGSVEAARALAKAEGVADRVRFEVHDATRGLPGSFDVVTAFDVVHDVADPPRLLRHVRAALRPGGRFVSLEINAQDKLEDNAGPIGTLVFGVSAFYCMSIALAEPGGLGYGTGGLPEGRFRALAKDAGFADLRKVDIGNPLNVLYEGLP